MPEKNRASGTDQETQLAHAALKLLNGTEWGSLTLASVARAAKHSLPGVLGIVPSKSALPGVILRLMARETGLRYSADAASDNPRERLFDVAMTWFDVQQQQPQAKALKRLYGALQYDPATLFALRGDMLQVAGEF